MEQTILAEEFLHPEDRAALAALKSVPGIDIFVKTFMNYGIERLMRGMNMASNIRLSPTQLPEIYELLPPICSQLGIAVPELYLSMNPFPNAYALGDTTVSITVTTGLLEHLTQDEIRAVLAHECGHIASHHMLYQTMAVLLMNGVNLFAFLQKLPVMKFAMVPIHYALLYWSRKAELSCDRVASLICGTQTTSSMLLRLAGGSKQIVEQIDLKEWAAQAEEYRQLQENNKWDKTLQMYATMDQRHPFLAQRVQEVIQWGKSANYASLRARLFQMDPKDIEKDIESIQQQADAAKKSPHQVVKKEQSQRDDAKMATKPKKSIGKTATGIENGTSSPKTKAPKDIGKSNASETMPQSSLKSPPKPPAAPKTIGKKASGKKAAPTKTIGRKGT